MFDNCHFAHNISSEVPKIMKKGLKTKKVEKMVLKHPREEDCICLITSQDTFPQITQNILPSMKTA